MATEMKDQLDQLKREIDELKRENDKLNQLKSEIDELKKENDELKKGPNDLRSTVCYTLRYGLYNCIAYSSSSAPLFTHTLWSF